MGMGTNKSADIHNNFNVPLPNNTEKSESSDLLEGSKTTKRFSPLLRQCLAASGPIMVTIGSGMTSGYSATLLPQLMAENSTIAIDDEQASWIASISPLPMSLGCIMSGYMIEKFGRRMTHFLLSVPFVFGWVIISFSMNFPMLLLGRFITGLCVGLAGPAGSVYIGEISDPKYRGFLLAAISLAVALGLFLAHLFGTFFSWQFTASLCALFPLVCYILIFMVPETPSWLAKKGKLKEAEESFRWLRGCDQASLDEMNAMLRKQREITVAAKESQPVKTRELLSRPECWKPLLIINLYFFTTQFSGVNAVAFYSVSIMKDTVGHGINEYLAMLVIDTLRVIMSVVACVLTRNYGRRPLTLLSGLGTAISLIALAANSHLAVKHAWFPMTALVGYITFVSIGLVPLPWALTGEVFPLAVRGFASGATSAFAFLVFFTVVKTGPIMFKTLGSSGTFFCYGSVALAGTIILFFFLPETRNKTLQDIEEHFADSPKKKQNTHENV